MDCLVSFIVHPLRRPRKPAVRTPATALRDPGFPVGAALAARSGSPPGRFTSETAPTASLPIGSLARVASPTAAPRRLAAAAGRQPAPGHRLPPSRRLALPLRPSAQVGVANFVSPSSPSPGAAGRTLAGHGCSSDRRLIGVEPEASRRPIPAPPAVDTVAGQPRRRRPPAVPKALRSAWVAIGHPGTPAVSSLPARTRRSMSVPRELAVGVGSVFTSGRYGLSRGHWSAIVRHGVGNNLLRSRRWFGCQHRPRRHDSLPAFAVRPGRCEFVQGPPQSTPCALSRPNVRDPNVARTTGHARPGPRASPSMPAPRPAIAHRSVRRFRPRVDHAPRHPSKDLDVVPGPRFRFSGVPVPGDAGRAGAYVAMTSTAGRPSARRASRVRARTAPNLPRRE